MKTSFSEGKLMKQFGNPLFLRGFPLSTNPTISEQSFHDLLLVQISKTYPHPLILEEGREQTMKMAAWPSCFLTKP